MGSSRLFKGDSEGLRSASRLWERNDLIISRVSVVMRCLSIQCVIGLSTASLVPITTQCGETIISSVVVPYVLNVDVG